MQNIDWIRCPVCGNKTRDRIREDTILKNYPLYCPKCKQQTLIEAKDLQVTVIKEPDAQTQSRFLRFCPCLYYNAVSGHVKQSWLGQPCLTRNSL